MIVLVNYYEKLSRDEDKCSSNKDGEPVPGGLGSGPFPSLPGLCDWQAGERQIFEHARKLFKIIH